MVMWDFFISYASEDRERFVAPLVLSLKRRGFQVWFDELVISPGDSIREAIERGIARSRIGVVVLSDAFFLKRWPLMELGGLFSLHASTGHRLVPIWYGIDKPVVTENAPMLADFRAIRAHFGSMDVSSVSAELARLLRDPDGPSQDDPRSIRVDHRRLALGIDESFVAYHRALVKQGHETLLLIDIHKEALRRQVAIPNIVWGAIQGSTDVFEILSAIPPAQGLDPGSMGLFVALQQMAPSVTRLEEEIRTGTKLILMSAVLDPWIGSDAAAAIAIRGFVEQYFVEPHEGFRFCAHGWLAGAGPQKTHFSLPLDEAREVAEDRFGAQKGLPFIALSHEAILRYLLPAILRDALDLVSHDMVYLANGKQARIIHDPPLSDERGIKPEVLSALCDLRERTIEFEGTDAEWKAVSRDQ